MSLLVIVTCPPNPGPFAKDRELFCVKIISRKAIDWNAARADELTKLQIIDAAIAIAMIANPNVP